MRSGRDTTIRSVVSEVVGVASRLCGVILVAFEQAV